MNLTSEAQQRLDQYLQKVRSAVRGTSASAREVEQDVREHVAAALPAGEAGGVAELDAILGRLGDPSGWLSDSDLPVWRRFWRKLVAAPEDWRLAYTTFVLTILGLLTLPTGFGVVLLFGAFLVGRAFVEAARDHDVPIGARRWLVYPPIAMLLAAFVTLAVIGPILPLAHWFIDEGGYSMITGQPLPSRPTGESVSVTFVFLAVVAGTWWLLLSGALIALVRPLRFVFRPLLDAVQKRHIAALAIVGAAALAAGLFVLLLHS